MMAQADWPFLSLSEATESLVIEEVISMPGAISRTTTELTGPFLMDLTLPGMIFRALIFMASIMVRFVANAFGVMARLHVPGEGGWPGPADA